MPARLTTEEIYALLDVGGVSDLHFGRHVCHTDVFS